MISKQKIYSVKDIVNEWPQYIQPLKGILLSACLLLFTTSCIVQQGGFIQAPANITSANFRVVGSSLKGSSNGSYLLGIFVNGKRDLYHEALEDLKKKSPPLEENQSYCCYVVDAQTVHIFGPLIYEKRLTLRADIVEFFSPEFPRKEIVMKEVKPILTGNAVYDKIQELRNCEDCNLIQAEFHNLKVGDIVAIKKGVERAFGQLTGFDEEKVEIKLFLGHNASQYKTYSIENVYLIIE